MLFGPSLHCIHFNCCFLASGPWLHGCAWLSLLYCDSVAHSPMPNMVYDAALCTVVCGTLCIWFEVLLLLHQCLGQLQLVFVSVVVDANTGIFPG